MSTDQLNREVIGFSKRLTALLARYDAGERSTLYSEMRELTDQIVCMIDEVPERRDGIIGKLADRCETFLRQLSN